MNTPARTAGSDSHIIVDETARKHDLPAKSNHDSPDESFVPSTNTSPGFSDMYQIMLPMAKEYIAIAHSRSLAIKSVEDIQLYFKLVTTGIRCFEAVIRERNQPYVECLALLNYAQTLYIETNQLGKAEDALNKGIVLAGRSNLYDIKFTMQHLFIRILAQKNLKAAHKLLRACAQDAEAKHARERLSKLHVCLEGQKATEGGRWNIWHEDGEFLIALPPDANGRVYSPLRMRWLTQPEVYALSYLISGLVSLMSNTDRKLAGKYIAEGLNLIIVESALTVSLLVSSTLAENGKDLMAETQASRNSQVKEVLQRQLNQDPSGLLEL
ncbi:cohesin loading factor-domain-containing protein [Dipodascopsis tothii]|uniref:cohesin loading factor-domain-containing protein n=1 Tax=Dipodascopsis tothii TaxID=44089 RepID=UPI0034CD60AC